MSVVALEVAQGIGVCTPIAPMPGSCVVEFEHARFEFTLPSVVEFDVLQSDRLSEVL